MALRYYKSGEKPVVPRKEPEIDFVKRFPPLIHRRTGMMDPHLADLYFSPICRDVDPYTGIKHPRKK